MAERPVIIMIGSSNEAGFAALLDEVPTADMVRWIGAGGLHPPIPSTPEQRPYEVRIPGLRALTPIMPYSMNESRMIVGVGGGQGTIDYAGAQVGATRDSWIYIRTNKRGQGALRRVVSDPATSLGTWLCYRGNLLGGDASQATHRLFIAENPKPPALNCCWPFFRAGLLGGGYANSLSEILQPDAFGSWGSLNVLKDSSTIAAVDITQTRITKTEFAAPFTQAVVDRDVLFFHDNSVRKVVAFDSESITVERPINLRTWAPTVAFVSNNCVIHNGIVYVCKQAHSGVAGINDPPNVDFWRPLPDSARGFCIHTGANSCEDLDDLADPDKCVLQDLTFYLDQNAVVHLTGRDRYTGDATPFQNPKIAYEAGPFINSVPELGFLVRSELQDGLVVVQMGISASMISPFLQGSIHGPEPIPPWAGFLGWFSSITSLDFHPSSPNALFQAVANEWTSARLLLEAEGHTAKCVGIFINLFDNDPGDEERANLIGANTEVLRDALREHIGDDSVPFIMAGPSRYGGIFQQLVYDQLFAVEAGDVHSGVVDMRVGVAPVNMVFPDDFAADGLHFSATGQIKKARGYFGAWKEVLARVAAAAVPAPVDTSPAAIIARIDAAILDGVDVLSFPGNGGQITLRGFDEMMRMREKMVALAAKQSRLPRRTLARFQ